VKLRQTWTAIRVLLIFSCVLGIAYPAAVLAIGQVALPAQANGSPLEVDGEVVGSALIGQSFTDAEGAALPEWFQSRPSATGYDGAASSGSNYGPGNQDLLAAVDERRAALGGGDDLPSDALTASASGLDPQISPEYALLQVPRVAGARGLNEGEVRDLVDSMIRGRDLGYLGEPTVNVLQLNIALAKLG
jgi:potassium-transporting ATPase KdpC subunit